MIRILNKDFSQYEEERLYSTGNEELDELMERAFCDGYEYAQKEFGILDKVRDFVNQDPAELSRKLRNAGNKAYNFVDQYGQRFGAGAQAVKDVANMVQRGAEVAPVVAKEAVKRAGKYVKAAHKDITDLRGVAGNVAEQINKEYKTQIKSNIDKARTGVINVRPATAPAKPAR